MKKLIVYLAVIMAVNILVVIIVLLYPEEVKIHAQGLKYRLGTSDVNEEKLINVDIEGKVHKSITGKRTFTGTIDIEGEEIPVPEDQRTLNHIPFMRGNMIGLMYSYFVYSSKTGAVVSPEGYVLGTLVFNDDFSQATILLAEQLSGENEQGSSWDGEHGRMVTVPASNRAEAIRITNELLKDIYKGYIFE